MQRLAVVVGLVLWAAAPAKAQDMPPQAQRGRELFLNSPKGVACAACHQIKDLGIPAGPDLRTLASAAVPKGLVTAIQMTMTEYVREYKVKGMGSFPAMKAGEEGDQVLLYDLSNNKPELKKVAKNSIDEVKPNTKWKHPPTSASYNNQELADLIGFLRFAATGSRSEVKPEDLK
ncbi:MAG: cytochrome c [Bryobacteraceae bacterium]|nr:cytochrome c [Bryobacteraceae bacterium]